MKKFFIFTIALVFVLGCGKKSEYHFETRELTPEEVKALELENPQANFSESAPNAGPIVGPLAIVLVNALAGIAQKLITPGESNLVATMMGHALPPKVAAFDLANIQDGEKVYEKRLKSTFGFTVVELIYKIGYQYGAHYKGKGDYIANVKFVPLRVKTDPMWSIRASSLSEEPINIGTRTNPSAKLSFSVTFTAQGPGTRGVTDEFSLDGVTGVLDATVREFE